MDQPNPLPSKQTALVICSALCMGPTFFAILVLVLNGGKMVFDPTQVLSLVGVGMASVSVVVSFIAWQVVTASAARQIASQVASNASGLQNSAQSKLQSAIIIRYALIEGGVFFLLLASMVEKNLFPWCVGVLLIGLMIALLPFPSRYEAMLEKITGRRN